MPLPVGFSNLSCYSRELIKQSVKEGIEDHKRLSEFKDKPVVHLEKKYNFH